MHFSNLIIEGLDDLFDLFLLFVFYEIAIIPKYFLIAIWGSTRKSYGAMKLVLYSFVGSALALVGIMAAFGLSFLGIAKYPVFSNTKTLDFQATAPPSLSWSEQLEQRSPGSIAVCAAELGEYGDKLITTIK